jgi:outer membrane protein assembly factor BamB
MNIFCRPLKVPFISVFCTSFFALSLAHGAETHRILTSDASKKIIAILDERGTVEWQSKTGNLHDLHLLPNGNVLFQTGWTEIVEVNPKSNETVWSYDSAKQGGNEGKKIEVHAFQRLPNGLTMIAESGPARIIEVDAAGKIVAQIALKVSQPHPHRDTRLARKLPSGNYLVCHEGEAAVREYNSKGEVVWEFDVPLFGKQPKGGHGLDAFGNQCYAALRLENGNTLISTGNGHSVIEVTSKGEVVWKLEQDDLPGIRLAWVTTLQQLPNGNLVIGNCHAEKENPQIIEITRDKKVVWKFQDFERFGNSLTNTQVLTTSGKGIDATLGVHR